MFQRIILSLRIQLFACIFINQIGADFTRTDGKIRPISPRPKYVIDQRISVLLKNDDGHCKPF